MMERKYREDEARPSGNTSSSNDGVFLFDVFLSFSGEDTRQGFTSHLYQALKQSQVETFIDNEDLPKGERISQLIQYMESSQIFVPILSKKYAKSKWCLLEAAKMVKIYERDQQKRKIIPVFYKVDPSEVKDDGGLYMSAIVELQKEGGLERVNVQDCIDALKTIGRISGFAFKKGTKETEADIITSICKRVQGLVPRSVPFGDQPIGIDSQIDESITMLMAQADGVCIIGICGMGGIGKTTIAKAITDKLFSEFDGSSFIEDVGAMAEREGLPAIQQKLICDVLKLKQEVISIHTVDGRNNIKRKLKSKRVLIVLDNIVELEQLQKLLGDHICHKPKDFFGKGSKIIVTARDEGILLSYGMEKHQIHHPRELKPPWALQLFHRHAFVNKQPPLFEFLDLAQEAARIAGGLPLVLKTVGSYFARLETIEEWEGELEKIRKNRDPSIWKKLKWSYDGLDDDQKCVFLDIACFFVGAKRKRATYLWDDRSPGNAIKVLQERNLINIDDEDRFRMHDKIQEMGRWIVSSEGNLGPHMNSRLCSKNVESITSMNSQEKGKVEGMVLNMEEECTANNLTTKVFVDMPKLRLLHLNFVNFLEPKIVQFPNGLKWLRWRGCQLESVTFDRTSFKNLAILDLSQSSIHELKLNNKLDRLNVLDLSNCWYIEATPDFSCTPKLEKLFLDDCRKLREVHESICCLQNLTTLSMRNCQSVEELPKMHRCSIANLSKLEELNLQGCQQLQFLPRLPSSLKTLILQGCKRLKPALGFQNLESMELLDMDGCENINFTLMSGLFKGKTFSHLEELSASRSKTLSEDETFCFVVPLGSPSSPLLLQQLQCYGDGSKSGSLSNIYIKVCVKDMEDNRVIYETIFSGHRDFDNDIGGQYWCYTVSFSEYDDINILSNLCRPCSISISTANDFFLRSVHILLRSASKWNQNYSKVISVGENVTKSRRISAEQNQINAFEFDVLFRYVKEDIDTEFINNLYRVLQQHGICIFKGEDALSKEGELLNCIERSAICIPIFSKRFSQSKWHLKSVAKMVESRKFIIPIYFQVRPLDIKDQEGEFGAYFSSHKNEDQRETVEDWKKALEVVVRQWHHQFSYLTDRYMEELITVICNRISSMLNSVTFRKTPPWFGVKDVIRMLEKDESDVCILGICGPSGIGKTTIAKAVYDQLSREFDASVFIPSVWPFEERKWQFKQQRALIVFDDVDGLDNFFESRRIFGPHLFGKGSKIIVIAKDKRDLVRYGVKKDNIYFAHELNNMQSLRLLGYYAFKGKQPTTEIVELARKVTEFAGGLPLGLAVLGSLLSSMRTKEEWESMLEKLSSAPGEGIDKVLKVSMDALDTNQLQEFFDIAWLKECACYPGNTIKFLEGRCLISFDAEDRPRMHNRIRNYGKKWGAQKGCYKCWMPAMNILDGLDLCQQNIFLDVACCLIGCEKEYAIYMWEDCGYSPTDAIEVLQHRSLIRIDEKGRFKMDIRVRHVGRVMVEKHELTPSRIWNENSFLEALDGWTAGWSNDNIEGINAIFSRYRQGPMRIETMGNLRILHLTNCYFQYNRLQPLKNLRWLQLEMCDVNSSIFKDGGILEKLLVLQLHCCRMLPLDMQEVASAGNKRQEVFKKLKVLEIRRCSDVAMAYLDFSLMPSLVKLLIEGIEYYSGYFHQIPRSLWGLGKLEYLRITGGATKKLSSSISNLSSLQTLDLEDTWLSELPEGLGDLAALRELILSGCVSLKHLPQLPCSLQTLDLGGCRLLSELPECLGKLAALRELILSGCVSLKHLPQLPCSLQTLVLGGCRLLSELPESLGDLATLRELILSGCVSLDHLPQLPPSLQRLDLRGSKRLLELPKDLGDLAALRELILRNCNELKEIPSSVVQLKHLRTLIIINCCRLHHLPQLPSSLITLDAYGCINLRQVADISNLQHLEILNLDRCDVLEVVPGLHNLQSLTFLRLPFHLSQREKL